MTAPRADQLLLLRAALGVGADALEAWATWRARVDVEKLDRESVRLLPLLYRNLRRLGVDAAATARYASVYKQTWALNRMLFHAGAGVLAALARQQIDTLVLKGAALALLHYQDVGARAMEDVDVLIAPARRREAQAVLVAHGFRAAVETGPAFVAGYHSCGFKNAAGRAIDLHWFASGEARRPGADDDLWRRSVPLLVDGVPTRALAPTDLLYHVLAHAHASVDPHLRWMADAMTLLRAGVDWDALVALARARRFARPVADALARLSADLGADVPLPVVAHLAAEPLGWIDRLELRQRRDRYAVGDVLLRLWSWHRRSAPEEGPALLASFPRFLCSYYDVASAWQLPSLGVSRAWRRLRNRWRERA
jgi:hypothetical protein